MAFFKSLALSPDWIQLHGPETPHRVETIRDEAGIAILKAIAIGSAELSAADTALAITTVTVVGSLSVALPVVLFVVHGERMLEPIGRARDWLERNNAAVMAVVITVIGVLLLVKGYQGLR